MHLIRDQIKKSPLIQSLYELPLICSSSTKDCPSKSMMQVPVQYPRESDRIIIKIIIYIIEYPDLEVDGGSVIVTNC